MTAGLQRKVLVWTEMVSSRDMAATMGIGRLGVVSPRGWGSLGEGTSWTVVWAWETGTWGYRTAKAGINHQDRKGGFVVTISVSQRLHIV